MNWDRLTTQLEQILHTEFRMVHLSMSEWHDRGGNESSSWLDSRELRGQLYFPVLQGGDEVTALVTDASLMTESEKKLVELAIQTYQSNDKKSKPKNDKERLIADVRNWIEERVAEGAFEEQEPIAEFTDNPMLRTTKVPFLIYGENVKVEESGIVELKKLLESFFDVDIIIIPLRDKEWLILANEALLTAAEDDELEESLEERLASLCSGVQSVIFNEGTGECHVTVHYPIIPIKSLPLTVVKLREAISVGRMQRVGQYIHLPWELYLDQLLTPLTHVDRMRFIEQVFKRKDPLLDAETIQTLETFFELNCNVSETAKKLYIHRNTLLYRLDKFKQESGLDVRTFNQAVHVKIALQLYKVTKRV